MLGETCSVDIGATVSRVKGSVWNRRYRTRVAVVTAEADISFSLSTPETGEDGRMRHIGRAVSCVRIDVLVRCEVLCVLVRCCVCVGEVLCVGAM